MYPNARAHTHTHTNNNNNNNNKSNIRVPLSLGISSSAVFVVGQGMSVRLAVHRQWEKATEVSGSEASLLGAEFALSRKRKKKLLLPVSVTLPWL